MTINATASGSDEWRTYRAAYSTPGPVIWLILSGEYIQNNVNRMIKFSCLIETEDADAEN